MSFILQLFHAPQVRTIAQADAFIDSHQPPAEANRARFIAFRDDILRTYPDNSDADDDDEEADNVWPEGWSDELDGDPVLVFAVDTDSVDENLLWHIAHAAARAGLHLLDPQNGCLYRADGISIDMEGTEERIGTPQPPRAKQRLPKDITEERLGAYITAGFIARHPEAGFAAGPSPSRSFASIERTLGGVKQRIRFYISLRTEEALIGTSIELYCPNLAAVWERLLAEHVAAHVATQRGNPGRRPDLSLDAHDFDEPPGKNVDWWRRSDYQYVRSMADADAFIARFEAWYTQKAAPALARLTTPTGLARLALSDYQMKLIGSANNFSIEEMFGRLVMIGAFDAARKEEWMAVLRDHRKRQGKFGGADSIVPDRNTALEKLFGMLGGAAFAAEAAQLRDAPAPASASTSTSTSTSWTLSSMPPVRYVLRFWEQPVGRYWPRDAQAAAQWLALLGNARPRTPPTQTGPNPRFIELARRLSARYPEIVAAQAEGASAGVPPSGAAPLDGKTDLPIYAIDLNTAVPGELRPFVLDTARALELSMLDEQAGEYHYANGFVVTPERGFRHRLPENVFKDPAAPGYRLQPADDLLPLAGMLDLICLRLDKFLKRHGFIHRPDPEAEATAAPQPRFVERNFRRPQGAGWSELQIGLAQREQAIALQIDCAACLSEAARLNKQYFVANGGEDDGEEHATAFTRQHFWMTDPQDLLGTDSGCYYIAKMADLDPALAHFTTQAQQRLLPVLAAFDSVAGVDALLNAGPFPSSIFFEGAFEFAENHLVAARVARNPRFEALCKMYIDGAEAYRAGKRRSVFGDTVQKLRDLSAFLKAR